jgi:hypothetical protein
MERPFLAIDVAPMAVVSSVPDVHPQIPQYTSPGI